MPIRVLVADDHPLVRRGTCEILAADPGLEVVGQAADGVEALERAAALTPDVVVVDISMPRMDGVEVARRLREKGSFCRVLALSAGGDDDQILAALQAGALGYLLKSAPEDLILEAVRLVAAGKPALLQPEVAQSVLSRATRPAGQRGDYVEPLSEREIEVLKEVARDRANKEAARILGISDRTVQQHLANIFSKLGVASRTGAVLEALHQGVLKLEDCRP
ncbi:MAG: response regulator transcription factor [Candidatus Sericytochromatia bacterium]|nr:response regulator transcription factor [Candidatus Tanganyikabacteria bacterium]